MIGSAIRTPDQRLRVFVSSTMGELAEERRAVRAAACLMAGRLEDAGPYLDEAQAALWEGDPEEVGLEILRGDLLMARPDPDPRAAEAAFTRAAALGEALGARMGHLQALARLAGLRHGIAGEAAAHTALRDALESFTEGFGSGPLLEAREVLDGARDQSRG